MQNPEGEGFLCLEYVWKPMSECQALLKMLGQQEQEEEKYKAANL